MSLIDYVVIKKYLSIQKNDEMILKFNRSVNIMYYKTFIQYV